MKRFALLCLCLLAAAPAWPQGQNMPEMGAPKQMDVLRPLAGEWNLALKYRGTPEMPWQETKATETSTLVLDGACLMSETRGDMMGTLMKGLGMMSYNRNTKMWQGTWIDNLSGSISYMEGSMKSGNLVFEGEDTMAGQTFKTRATYSNLSSSSYDFSMEMSMDGGKTWVEMMSGKYTRAQASKDDGGW